MEPVHPSGGRAITVVLAATVFVLVQDIGSEQAEQAPQIGWNEDESDDAFKVTQSPNQVFWRDFEIKTKGMTELSKAELDKFREALSDVRWSL